MSKRERIMIITDSVSMPRQNVKYEDTWIYLFKNRFMEFDVIDRPARGSTSMRLVQEGGGGFDLLELYTPDRVILQQGLAECAPRLFKKNGFEKKFINTYLPAKIRSDYIKAVKAKRGRNPEFTDVNHIQFRYNVSNFAERCAKLNVKLAIIKILKPTDLYLSKSPFIKQNIDLYNSIYHEISERYDNVTIIDPVKPDIDVNLICLDELHINSEGHKLYFKEVENYFKKVK
ncbi:MAG: hypothetical protein CVV49_02065 [Spirochaetae bacterium HGW-Spirochaetae-5]|nr:MAG: hypothetical protein CVV49_02065 [Spirochaetae bacterium HGW-Spirochaetae-5]